MFTHPTAPHRLEKPLPPTLSAGPSFSKEAAQRFPKAEVLVACRAVTGSGRGFRARTPAGEVPVGGPASARPGRAAANYASQAAPLPPRAPAPRPAGSRLLIARLPGPLRRRCSAVPARYLGADGRTARTAGYGMGALTGERAGVGGRPGRGTVCIPRPAVRGWPRPPGGLEDAPRRPRLTRRAPRAGAAGGLPPRPGGLCGAARAGGAPGVWVPRSALRLRSLGSPAGRCSEGAVSCLPRAAGLGFSTLGFVPLFPLSCDCWTSSWSPVPVTASLQRATGKGAFRLESYDPWSCHSRGVSASGKAAFGERPDAGHRDLYFSWLKSW